MLSEQRDHTIYLRSMCTSCCSLENSRGTVESLLNPRLISARVSLSSTILKNKETFIIQNTHTQLLSPYRSLFCEPIIIVPHYLGGTAVSWFLLKLTFVTWLLLTASNTSSGINASCFSLRRMRGEKTLQQLHNWHKEHMGPSGKTYWIVAKNPKNTDTSTQTL